jgi:hypothetical protein
LRRRRGGARVDAIQDEILSFAAAATFAKGTLIARRTAASVSAGTVQGGTGTGTISAVDFVEGPVVPMAGAYKLICIAAVANGGVFQLLDPNGAVGSRLPADDGGRWRRDRVRGGRLTFTVTDAADFIVGNFFLITVVAGSKCVPYNPAGKGGEQRPIGVLLDEYTKAASGDLCGARHGCRRSRERAPAHRRRRQRHEHHRGDPGHAALARHQRRLRSAARQVRQLISRGG